MQPITVQLGNSDDKLTQVQWAHCVAEAREQIDAHVKQVHFFGFSEPAATWQNAACVAEIPEENIKSLKNALRNVALLMTPFSTLRSVMWPSAFQALPLKANIEWLMLS